MKCMRDVDRCCCRYVLRCAACYVVMVVLVWHVEVVDTGSAGCLHTDRPE